MIGAGAAATTLSGAYANADVNELVPETPDEGGKVRHFDVHAICVDIVYNAFGQHQPNGVMYVLEENEDAARRASGCAPGGDVDTSVLQPLVIRANEGDVVEIEFHNDLDCRASMHQYGLLYEVAESDGLAVGFNEDTTVAPGESITYRWFADPAPMPATATEEGETNGPEPRSLGTGVLSDFADVRSNRHLGAFGNLIVEPEGSTWLDSETGEPIRNGTQAMITGHDGEDFQEFALLFTEGM